MSIFPGNLKAFTASPFRMPRPRFVGDDARLDTPNTVRLFHAAQTLGFRRIPGRHPVDSIDDPRIAVAGVAAAYLAIGETDRDEADRRMVATLQSTLGQSRSDAAALTVLAHWLIEDCETPELALPRLARTLERLAETDGLRKVTAVIAALTKARGTPPNDAQSVALQDIKRIFRT